MGFRKLTAVGATALVAALIMTGCGPSGEGASADANLTIGSFVEPMSFDPAQAAEGHFLQYYQPVYDTLIRRTPDGEYEPMLATAWKLSDDNLTLTLDLRAEVTFTDGAVFNSEAAKANLDHFRASTGPLATTLAAVESVDIVDDDTVDIVLNAPEPSLLFYLSNAAGLMGSPEALGSEDIATTPVGSGPYVLERSVVGSEYTYVKRDDYWDPQLQKFDQITIKLIEDATAIYNALSSGQINAAPLTATVADRAEADGLVAHTQGLDWQGLLLWDRGGQMQPALGDVRVRQAINYAIDKEGLLATVQSGRGEITSQVFGPESDAYVADLEDAYSYDPAKAKALLADAGYADGFTLPMPIVDSLPASARAAVVEQFAAVGIEIVWEETNDLIVEMRDYPAMWMSLSQPSTWQNINQVVTPQALWNALGYTDPEVERMVTSYQFAEDEAAAAATAAELGTYLVEQAWFAPWYRPDQLFYTDDTVSVELQPEQAVPSIYNYSPVA